MAVYCDVCTQPGSPNDNAGYTTNGGWFCPAHRQIEFTPEEQRALSEAITRAAIGIAQCWDVLLNISGRMGRDWEPVDTCVSDIADYCASSIDDPAAVELLTPDSVAEYFSDRRTGRAVPKRNDRCWILYRFARILRPRWSTIIYDDN